MAFDKDFQPPLGLRTDEFLLRQLVTADNPLDYQAVMESKEFLRIWEDPAFPPDDFTVEDNLKDVVKMEGRHNTRHSFAYTMMNPTETETLGCVYISPTDVSWYADAAIAPVGDTQWSDYDTSVSFWVRTSRVADGLDQRVLDALIPWLKDEWSTRTYLFFTAEALDGQRALYEGAGMELKFRTTEPDASDSSVAYA